MRTITKSAQGRKDRHYCEIKKIGLLLYRLCLLRKTFYLPSDVSAFLRDRSVSRNEMYSLYTLITWHTTLIKL